MRLPLPPLAAAVLLALPTLSVAAESEAHDDHARAEMSEVVVTASPLKQSAEELTRPVSVLSGAALDAARANTLGATLEGLPGVQSSSFGPGVGRPVIRGLDGARVQTLSGGLSSLDASTVSADHAVSIEPFLAEQIEVLKGPATLLYGSGAIGGAVNVVDGRIPELPAAAPLSGRAELRAASGNDERSGMFKLDAGGERFTLHVDGAYRDSDDVEIPGYAESAALLAEEGETPDPATRGVLPNSALRTASGAVGASWFGERGFIGASASRYESLYGIPGHGHEHEEGEPEEGGEEEEGAVRIDLEQDRYDLKGSLLAPFAGHDSLSLRLAHNHYRHVELEGDEIGTRFSNDGLEGRIEAVHAEAFGWRGAWGLQFGSRDFRAVGAEAFVPPSKSRDLGLFVLEQRPLGERLRLEVGARTDRVTIDPDNGPARDSNGFSASAGLRFSPNEQWHVDLGIDRAERAPSAEELFSNGPHVATQSFEIGDAGLDSEIANRLELGMHWHVGDFSGKAAAYTTRFSDFIYLAEQGREEDGLPVRQWTQADARFHGFELEAAQLIADNDSGRWTLAASADAVRARLDQGGDLPRIPAARVGLDLRWERAEWSGRIGALRSARQDRVAEFERPSEGYTLLNAELSYHVDVDALGWELFLDGRNLSDREARSHTSPLKELAPLPGRSIGAGIRVFF